MPTERRPAILSRPGRPRHRADRGRRARVRPNGGGVPGAEEDPSASTGVILRFKRKLVFHSITALFQRMPNDEYVALKARNRAGAGRGIIVSRRPKLEKPGT